MKWAMLDPAGRPSGFYHPDVHPDLFEQVGEELRPRGPIANAVPVSDDDWQDLVSHPGRRKIENGRVVATNPPPPTPEAQAEADRALLREAMPPRPARGLDRAPRHRPHRPLSRRARRPPALALTRANERAGGGGMKWVCEADDPRHMNPSFQRV
jgi:hypothetical protein